MKRFTWRAWSSHSEEQLAFLDYSRIHLIEALVIGCGIAQGQLGPKTDFQVMNGFDSGDELVACQVGAGTLQSLDPQYAVDKPLKADEAGALPG